MPYIPSPERPIRKRNVEVSLRRAIPKQRQRHGLILSPIDTRFIHTIKHHIHIRHHSRVPSKHLNQTPDRENRPALHTSIVHINIKPTFHDHYTKRRKFLRFFQLGHRNSSTSPRIQIVMNPPEEFRTFGS